MLVKGNMIGSMPKFDWVLLIPVFLGVSYYNIFLGWQLQLYSVTEAEDFGRYVFVLCLSFCQSFAYVLFIRLAVSLLKYIYQNKRQNTSS
ncbi:hypothetical protein SAMN05518871_102493 [Psychrobacillus sp. OK028]|nr:hypothetical protein SAMN05518871_102493 [Psychrobacillus sp. OK028]